MPIAVTLAVVAACSWNNPGSNPYIGPIPEAVYSYTDIPKSVQDRLYNRMQRRDYDDIVQIGAETIAGANNYSDLRQMHFGNNRRCEEVDRSKWEGRIERGLVYCEGEYCLVVPTVCRNVSRITRLVTAPQHVDKLENNYRSDEEAQLRELLKQQQEEEARRRKRVQTVPEPSTLALVMGAMIAILRLKKTQG